MKVTDRIITAFLVSAGLFSLAQATQYLATLSAKEKKALVSVSKMSIQKALVAGDPFEAQDVIKRA